MVSEAAIPARIARGPLRRRTEHRLVAGVAGGIADWLNAPVAFIRFLLVVAMWLLPSTVLAYAAVSLLLPAVGRSRPDWDNLVGFGRLGLVIAAPLIALSDVELSGSFDAGLLIATYSLLGTGAAVLLSADYRRGRALSAKEARATVLATLPVAGCAILLAAGIVLLPDVRWERAVPPVAVVGGAALLIGRRREFVAPALVALGLAVVVTASQARLEGGVGELSMTPDDSSGEPIVARRAVGDVTVDLSRLRRSELPVAVEVTAGRGDIEVTVPTRSAVEIDARVGRGSIHSASIETRRVEGYGRDIQGYDEHLTAAHPGLEGAPRVTVVAHTGSGRINIYRGPP